MKKEAIELDKMCVSEIVAKYESSHNAITVTEFYENGGCPICFSIDEAGCKKGCYLGEIQQKNEDYKDAFREIVKESGNVDRDKWPTQQQKCFAIAQQALK